MPPRITRVKWSAQELPFGVRFDEDTGVFSGIPEDAGEYTVPVTVVTNYGRDTKDVILNVGINISDYKLSVIGTSAATISRDCLGSSSYAPIGPDENGFYGIKFYNDEGNLVDVSELSLESDGLKAISSTGEYWICGKYDVINYVAKSTSTGAIWVAEPRTSTKPVSLGHGVKAMNFVTASYSNNSTYSPRSAGSEIRFLLTQSGTLFSLITNACKAWVDLGAGKSRGDAPKIEDLSGIAPPETMDEGLTAKKILCSDRSHVYTYTSNSDGGITFKKESIGYTVKKVLKSSSFSYLSEDGYLDNNPSKCDKGIIKNAWGINTKATFIQNENNEVYKYDTTNKEWAYMGVYDVKYIKGKVISSDIHIMMLCNDGTLYHLGSSNIPEIEAHSEFTQVFPDLRFRDIAYTPYLLYALRED